MYLLAPLFMRNLHIENITRFKYIDDIPISIKDKNISKYEKLQSEEMCIWVDEIEQVLL